MKKTITLILALSFLFCSITLAGENQLIGKWKRLDKENFYIEFIDGETLISYEGSAKFTITYKPVKDHVFKFQAMGMSGVCEFIVDSNKLSFTKEYDCAWKGEIYQRIK